MTETQLAPEAERLLDEIRRAKLAELAAWRRYLTAVQGRNNNSSQKTK